MFSYLQSVVGPSPGRVGDKSRLQVMVPVGFNTVFASALTRSWVGVILHALSQALNHCFRPTTASQVGAKGKLFSFPDAVFGHVTSDLDGDTFMSHSGPLT